MKHSKISYYNKNGWNIYYEELCDKYQVEFQALDKKIMSEMINSEEEIDYSEHCKKMVIKDDKQVIDMQSDYSLMHRCQTMNREYEYVLDYCLENDIKSVVDIGSAFAWQSDMFLFNNIEYYTINHFVDNRMRNLNKKKYFQGDFPDADHNIPKDTLAIVILSIGWPVYTTDDEQLINDFKGLSEQFNMSIAYIPSDSYHKIKHLFSESKNLKGSFYLLSNTKKGVL